MSTTSRRRDLVAVLTVSSLLCAQACFTYERPQAGTVPEPGARVRVQSATPFAVMPPSVTDAAVTAADCRVTLIEGMTTTASADAVAFDSVTHLVPASPDRRSCRWAANGAAVVPTAGAEVTVLRYSGKRTVGLLLGAGASFVVYVLTALSQLNHHL
jgi:hypothetical protein